MYRRPVQGPEAGAAPGAVGAAVCESCGAPDETLVEVHRVYLDTDGQGRVIGERVLPDVERWCLVCRTHYPHREVGTTA